MDIGKSPKRKAKLEGQVLPIQSKTKTPKDQEEEKSISSKKEPKERRIRKNEKFLPKELAEKLEFRCNETKMAEYLSKSLQSFGNIDESQKKLKNKINRGKNNFNVSFSSKHFS